MEISILLYAIELLQTGSFLIAKGVTSFDKLRNSSKKYSSDKEKEESGTENENDKNYERKKDEEKSNDSTPLLANSSKKQKQTKQLNLHLIGKLFLYRWARVIFDICVFIHFISILISYILAGSESWGSIFYYVTHCVQEKYLEYTLIVKQKRLLNKKIKLDILC